MPVLSVHDTEEYPMAHLHCDVAIIGAGTAGLAAERSARAASASTILIDDAFEGTTCAAVGCMPFTDPPLAIVGQPCGKDSIIGSASYADQGRATIEARNAGLCRLYADRSDGRLTGATLLAPGMDHIGHLLAWAIQRGETAPALLDLPVYHPTFQEGLKSALREICAAVKWPLPRFGDSAAAAGG